MKMKVSIHGADLGQAQPSIAQDKSTAPEPWETEEHLKTLTSAHEIKNDKAKMRAVHKLAGRKMKSIKSIQDIKDYAQSKYGPKKTGSKPNTQISDEEPDEAGSTF